MSKRSLSAVQSTAAPADEDAGPMDGTAMREQAERNRRKKRRVGASTISDPSHPPLRMRVCAPLQELTSLTRQVKLDLPKTQTMKRTT